MGKNPALSRPKDNPPQPANKSIKVGVDFVRSFIFLNKDYFYY